jgi:CheY-like chemotaxis protein
VKYRILIVEDNPLNSELLRDWLELEGYEVLLAANLNAAFAAVRAEHPNAVLLDCPTRHGRWSSTGVVDAPAALALQNPHHRGDRPSHGLRTTAHS